MAERYSHSSTFFNGLDLPNTYLFKEKLQEVEYLTYLIY